MDALNSENLTLSTLAEERRHHSSLLIAATCIIATIVGLLYAYTNDPLRKIPGPWLARYSRLWLWQEYRQGSFHQKNVDLHRKYGSVVRLAPSEYSIDDPDALRTIYGHGTGFIKSKWYIAAAPPSATHEQAVVSIFADRNTKRHANSRRKVASAYSLTGLLESEKYVDTTANALMGRLWDAAGRGEVIDLGFWLQCYAFDVIGEITFAKPFGFLDKGRDVDNIMANLEVSLRKFAPSGVFHELYGPSRRLHDIVGRLRRPTGRDAVAQFCKSQIQGRQREQSTPLGQDFLSRFKKIHEEAPDKFSEREIFQVCLTQITAGSDTTAISLRAILYLLYKHPAKLATLREEISQKLDSGGISIPVTYQQTLGMPYLQAVIKEAIRCHPATGIPLGREVPPGGAMISGHFFPAGNVVGVNSWVAHANTTVFGEDAGDFRPERWLVDKQKQAAMDRYFLAFGLGSRTCLGKNLAMMEIAKVVPRLVHDFDIFFEREWHLENMWFVKQSGLNCSLIARHETRCETPFAWRNLGGTDSERK